MIPSKRPRKPVHVGVSGGREKDFVSTVRSNSEIAKGGSMEGNETCLNVDVGVRERQRKLTSSVDRLLYTLDHALIA